jgi:Gpi18-like mannosyltransferase
MEIKSTKSIFFVASVWLLSRLVILVGMQLIAPLLPISLMHGSTTPTIGWQLFSNWDGYWYKSIAVSGYSYTGYDQVNLENQSSIAFFPLFPLVTRAVMSIGLPFEVAGTVVNNLAFLGALGTLYNWVEERHGINAARWSTAVLAWSPLSIFGTVTYTEGLFLLLTTASLQAFDKRQYAKAALWGAMATATRAYGVALIPTFLLVAWRDRRPAIAYFIAFLTGGGLLLFSLYCAFRFADPLAFVHAQKGWQVQTGFNGKVWWDLFTQDLLFRKGWSTAFFAVTKIVTFFGSSYLLWHLRAKLGIIAATYGFCAISMIIASGASLSIERFIFGIVSVSIALGLLLSGNHKWGYATISIFAIFLLYYSTRFAWGLGPS